MVLYILYIYIKYIFSNTLHVYIKTRSLTFSQTWESLAWCQAKACLQLEISILLWRKSNHTKNVLLQATHCWRCMLLTGPKPRDRTQCWVQCWLAEGTEADRFEDVSGRTCLQWRRQPDPTESTDFCNSSGSLVPMLNTQTWNWRSPALHGCQGTPCCFSEWVPPRCRSSRVWPYPVLVAGMLLVARNSQPGATVHKILCMLLVAWGQLDQSTPTLNCVHCSNWSLTHRLY